MPVMIAVIECAAADPLSMAAEGPLARYFDAGTYGLVEGDVESLLGPAFRDAALAAGVQVATERDAAPAADRTVRVLVPVPAAGLDAGRFDAWLSHGAPLVLLVASGAAAAVTAWGIVGFGVPSFGHLPTVSREDVWATCVRLAGGTPVTGRNLLEEPSAPGDPEGDARLTERLRQLYGE